jgi:mannose-6-phosphate isomerase
MHERRLELLGGTGNGQAAFPLLVKLLDANDWLSVQVHPDDQAVRRLWPGEGGKTEAWFVLDAAPGSLIYAGLRPGVEEQQLRQALACGHVADCLHSFTPRPGDCLFLPAGTVHAVGGGVLMAEVQQTSDATFRLFDWNRRDANGRSRELHVEQAFACINWKQGPVQPVHVADFCEPPQGPVERQPLVECRYFALEYVRGGKPFCCGGSRARIATVVRGAGRLETAACSEQVETGQTWLLPASAGEAWLKPQPGVGVLLTTLPLH